MTVKKFVGKIHLWLGLTSGLLVFLIAITGCLYAFQWEIQELLQGYRHVETRNEAFLPPSTLREIAERELPDRKIHGIQYEGNARAASVIFYDYDPLYYYIVYVNQYSGEVLKVKNMQHDFFYFVLQGHYYLWLPPAIGEPLVSIATLVFVVMLISGMVLWWPKKKKAKQRFRIKWDARWRRRNYDLHNVLGFYAMAIALVLALTGLVWGFEWFGSAVYRAAGGDKEMQYEEPASPSGPAMLATLPIDKLWMQLREVYPDVDLLEVHVPESDTSAIAVTVNPDRLTYWKADYHFYDQNTLEEVPSHQVYGRFEKADAADKLIRMNYDIHTGAILGLPGKVLAFFASLICASLPVTGFYIWYGRNYKKSSRVRTPVTVRRRRLEVPQEA